jgi:cholesterol oxidase
MELLLKQKYKYKTLPALSDSLGNGVLTNSETLCAVSSIPAKMNNGLAITSVFNPDDNTHIEVVKYPDGSNALKIFFWLSAGPARSNLVRFLKLIWNIIRYPHRFLKMAFDFSWSSNLVIFLVMQHIENAMSMKWEKNLFRGKMIIDNKGKLKVPAYIDIGQQVMERYAEKSGGIAQNIILEILFNRSTTAHILGGCPMSDDIGSGVVDKYLGVHGFRNMYVVDGSVIQGNIGVNPSFSILAMAEYAMNNIPGKSEKTQSAPELEYEGSR